MEIFSDISEEKSLVVVRSYIVFYSQFWGRLGKRGAFWCSKSFFQEKKKQNIY